MTRVLVSGCYDVLHAGHVQFFREAKALGTHLTVCFASAEVLWLHKRRRSSLPDDHKRTLIAALEMVDEVRYGALKRELCALTGTRYVVLPKTPPRSTPVSSSEIVSRIKAPAEAP